METIGDYIGTTTIQIHSPIPYGEEELPVRKSRVSCSRGEPMLEAEPPPPFSKIEGVI